MLESLWRDLKYAMQVLARRKTYTAVALLTLALCIGANTAIFSVVNSVLLRPLPFPEPEGLVQIYNSYPKLGVRNASNGVPDFLDRKRAVDIFESLTLVAGAGASISRPGSTVRVSGLRVTPDYFSVFRTLPFIGRAFTEEDCRPGNDTAVILSYSLWQQLFGEDRSALGKELRIDGRPRQVVGIMPQGYDFLRQDVALLVPFVFSESRMSDSARHRNFARMYGRLQPGVGLPQAQSKIDAINQENWDRFPQYHELISNSGFHTVVSGLHEYVVGGVRPRLVLLQAGVLIVLLIGCVNLANLMLVRSGGRSSELALRFALGAGRWAVARQLLTEGLLLALLGWALGLAVGVAAVQGLSVFGVDRLPRGDQVSLDRYVLLCTLAASLLTGLLFSAIPVLQACKSDLQSAFRGAGRTGSSGRSAGWTRSVLVVAQVSLAFVLLICAGLLLFSFLKLLQIDPGFESRNLLTAQATLPESRYPHDQDVWDFVERTLAQIRALPGVQQADITSRLPLSGNDDTNVISVEGYQPAPGENPPLPPHTYVSDGYFSTMGIPLLRGRFFDQRDRQDSACVAIIDQRLADLYWQGRDPVEGQLRRQPEGTLCTVIGVVGETMLKSLTDTQPMGGVYFSQRQFEKRFLTLVIRTEGSPESVLKQVRAEFLNIDPEIPLDNAQSMSTRIDRSLTSRRAPMLLIAVFGGVALLLSALGLYGVVAYSVQQRVREIGIRLALGALPSSILNQVLWYALRLTGLGLAIGAAASLAVSRTLSGMLYEVEYTSPPVFALAAVLLTCVAVLAALLPSLRAARVDAVDVLRSE